jgi:periplasmic protein CpxP/Spy
MSKLKIIFAFLILMLTFSAVNAQIEDEPDGAPPPGQNERPVRRPNLLRELGLNDVQIKQLRLINAESKPRLREAQDKMRDAKRALDEAIYADTVDNANIEIKLREFSAAEAEINRIRATTELAIRNVLTPEQLTRFRELRENFEQRRGERREKRQERLDDRKNPQQNKPTRRLQKRNRP